MRHRRIQLIFPVAAALALLWTGVAHSAHTVTGQWQVKAPLSGEGFAASIINGLLYVSHGYVPGDSTQLSIYDPATDTWTAGPPAGVPRSELVGAAAGGKHYAIGGRPAQSTVEVFDPVAGAWSAGPPMPTPRRGLGAATIGDKIYAVGGSTGSVPHSGLPLAANESLDTATNTWSVLTPMPIPMMDVYATVAVGSKVYVFGGFDGSSVSGTVQIFDTVSGMWGLGTPMPTPRSNAIAGLCGGLVLVIGGFDGFANLSVVEAYDPATDTWHGAPSKPTPGSEFAAGAVSTGSRIHAVGSGIFGAAQNVHETFECELEVKIDIKPGSDPNSIRLGNNGVVAVAILSDATFVATTVDPATVCFGDDPSNPANSDCTEAHGTGHVEDADGDGDLDMVLHFETAETGIDPGDTQACLRGTTTGGIQIHSCDAVRTP